MRALRRLGTLALAWLRYLPGEGAAAWGDLSDWLRTTFGGRGLLDSGQPWVTYRAQRWLRAHLPRGARVFEWGSGGSTRFFLDAGAREVVSIEHDGEWHRRVQQVLASRDGLALRHEPSEPEGAYGPDVLREAHGEYRSTHPAFRGQVFVRYVRAIRDAGAFDLVLVDGRARASCADVAREHVRPGGWLVFDNAEDAEYAPVMVRLREAGWQELAFDGPGPSSAWPGFWRTTVFVRPEATATTASARPRA